MQSSHVCYSIGQLKKRTVEREREGEEEGGGEREGGERGGGGRNDLCPLKQKRDQIMFESSRLFRKKKKRIYNTDHDIYKSNRGQTFKVLFSWKFAIFPHILKTNLKKFMLWNVCLLVGCLTSQQQASVSQGRICEDNFTCCHTEIEVADPTVYLTQSQYTDTGPTSPSADPITPGAWQGSHWSANFEVTGMTRPRKKSWRKRDSNPGPSALEADALTTRPTRRSCCGKH